MIALIKRESNGSKAYEIVIRSVGPPNKTVTENSQVLSGEHGPILIADIVLAQVSQFPITNTKTIVKVLVVILNWQLSNCSKILHMHH